MTKNTGKNKKTKDALNRGGKLSTCVVGGEGVSSLPRTKACSARRVYCL